MFRKPTFLQFMFQGPAAFIANKTVRRVAVAALVINDAAVLYRLCKGKQRFTVEFKPIVVATPIDNL